MAKGKEIISTSVGPIIYDLINEKCAELEVNRAQFIRVVTALAVTDPDVASKIKARIEELKALDGAGL